MNLFYPQALLVILQGFWMLWGVVVDKSNVMERSSDVDMILFQVFLLYLKALNENG